MFPERLYIYDLLVKDAIAVVRYVSRFTTKIQASVMQLITPPTINREFMHAYTAVLRKVVL